MFFDGIRIKENRKSGLALLGKRVYFAHDRIHGPYLVCSCDRYGMVELLGWAGRFGPHLFVLAQEEPASLPGGRE